MNKYKVKFSSNNGEYLVVMTTASTIQQAEKQVSDYFRIPCRNVVAIRVKETKK